MKKEINVLHICSYYYDSKLYKNLFDQFQENELKFSVYAPCRNNFNFEEKEKYLIQDQCFRKWDRLLFYYKYNKIYKSLKEKVAVSNFNILHAHSLFSNGYIAYKLYKEFNIPYIVAVRNTDLNFFFKYFIHLRKLGRDILENASAVVFISNSYKEKLLKKYIPKDKIDEIKKKSCILPNGIDEYFLNNLTQKVREKNQKDLNLVYTGKVNRNKNIETTIKCCKKILMKRYNVKFTVIGNIENQRYRRLIEKNKFIRYIGRKNKEEIIEEYRNMDLFVMPSKHETFGLTYVEAMSQGLPVIYTKNEGFDNFFKPGVIGYPIKYSDYKDMANKIALLLDNYNETSKNCVSFATDFNWKNISKKYIEIYKKIITKNYGEMKDEI